jgi:hypothetical protein
VTILGAQVFIKLVFTVIGLGLLVLAGRQIVPGAMDVNLPAFAAALLLSTLTQGRRSRTPDDACGLSIARNLGRLGLESSELDGAYSRAGWSLEGAAIAPSVSV